MCCDSSTWKGVNNLSLSFSLCSKYINWNIKSLLFWNASIYYCYLLFIFTLHSSAIFLATGMGNLIRILIVLWQSGIGCPCLYVVCHLISIKEINAFVLDRYHISSKTFTRLIAEILLHCVYSSLFELNHTIFSPYLLHLEQLSGQNYEPFF